MGDFTIKEFRKRLKLHFDWGHIPHHFTIKEFKKSKHLKS